MTASTTHKAFYAAFVASLLACLSPSKVLAYAVPTIVTFGMLPHLRGRFARNRLALVAYAVLGIALLYEATAPEFLPTNYALALVTYSSFLPIIVLDSRELASKALLRRMLTLCAVVIAWEGALGIVQFLYGVVTTGYFDGDFVEGTIHPQLASEKSFANPLFAVNLTLMLLACMSLPDVFAGRKRIRLVIGVVTLVLASVVHALIFAIAGIVFAYFWTRQPGHKATRRTAKNARSVRLVVVLLLGLTYIAFPNTVDQIANYSDTVLDMDALDVPRAILVYRVATELPQDAPLQPFIGLGPGQFSSRASLIASGLYLGGPDSPKSLPLLAPKVTRLAAEYCISLLVAFADENDHIGSTQQPFSSFMSVYTELGFLGLACVLIAVMRILRRVQRAARNDEQQRLPALLFTAGVTFLVLLGLQENYWEAPQAIFIGLLLLKVLYANIVHGASTDDPETEPT